ncbi:RNA12 protein-domain-containing protein [Cladochytrium replicatum]|nr:RNA12 protein-domain-containing protein [Cladochytrium replicatum]
MLALRASRPAWRSPALSRPLSAQSQSLRLLLASPLPRSPLLRSISTTRSLYDDASLAPSPPTTTAVKPTGNIIKGTLWFENVYPLNTGLLDPRRYLARFLSQSVEKEVREVFMPKKLPGGLEFSSVRLESNRKEGGVYVYYEVDKTAAVTSEPELVDGKAMVEKPIESADDVAKFVKLQVDKRAPVAWFNLNRIDVLPVRGEPWVEDMPGRPPVEFLRVEFDGPDVHLEQLFKEFRPFGRIMDITMLPASSKEDPRYATVQFLRKTQAIRAKNCVHGDVIDGTRISIHYDKRSSRHRGFEWIAAHQRIALIIGLGLFAGITYIIFDPIRVFYIQNKLTKKYTASKYINMALHWLHNQQVTLIQKTARLFGAKMNKQDSAIEAEDVWSARKMEAERLEKYLQETPDNFVLVSGPRGSGKSDLVMKAVEKLPYKLVVNCQDLVDQSEIAFSSRLAAQLGYFPVFSFWNSISGFADTIVTALTGAKAGLATNTEAQIEHMLEMTTRALENLTHEQSEKARKISERVGNKDEVKASSKSEIDVGDGPTVPVAAGPPADIVYPVVVIDGFMTKEKSRNDFLYETLARWGAMLEENRIAHVVFISNNPSAPRVLSRQQASKTLELVHLADADTENSMIFVRARLGLVFASSELMSSVEALGGRLTDLELLIQKIKAGAPAPDAFNDIVAKSIAEIRKVGLADDSAEAKKSIPWRTEQLWKVIQLLGKYEEVGYDELRMNPLFWGEEEALSQMESAGLINVIHHNSRPYSIRAGRPVYRVAFQRMVADTKLSATMGVRTLKRLMVKEEGKIRDWEDELTKLSNVLATGGVASVGREARRGIESRIDYLGRQLGASAKKCEAWTVEEDRLKAKLKLADA